MAGSAAARFLAPARASVTFDLASGADDASIRQLLRRSAFGGAIRVSLEREPDALAAATIEGDVHQTIVARDQATGRLVAVGARSVRTAFVNGEPRRVGYLSQLRIQSPCRQLRQVLVGGFEFCKALHDDGDTRLYLVSIDADNHSVLKLLTQRRLSGAPLVKPLERLMTLIMPVRRHSSAAATRHVHVNRAAPEYASELLACLQRNLRRFQFAPVWDDDDLRSPSRTKGLALEDFFVATRGGRVVGCLALWDQRAFKQVVVRGYSKGLERWRPIVNLATILTGAPVLPPTGQPFQFAYLSHVAIDEDRPDVLMALLAATCRRARELGLDHVVTAFATRHPLYHAIARHFRHRQLSSLVCAAHWPDGVDIVRALDGRIPQPEVAVL